MTKTAAPSRHPGTVYGPRRAGTWTPAAIALVVGAGLGLGVATQVLRGMLPDALSRLADSGAVWLTVAFIVGSSVPRGIRNTAAAGAGTLAAALVAYSMTALVGGAAPAGAGAWVGGSTLAGAGAWVATALIGGPLFGIAGGWLRDEASWLVGGVPWRRIGALAMLGGALAAAGLRGVFIEPTGNPGSVDLVAWLMLLGGPLVPLVIGRTATERLYGTAALPLVLVAGLGAFAAIH